METISMTRGSYLQLPDIIKRKHACVNVQNKDNQSFKWAILSALHPVVNHAQRISKYQPYKDELNFEGIEFPVTPEQIGKFENQNEISVNLYVLRKRGSNLDVYPYRITSMKKNQHVNLLLVHDSYRDKNSKSDNQSLQRFHYVWIKNLPRLMKSHGFSMDEPYVCEKCLRLFQNKNDLIQHDAKCTPSNDESFNSSMPSSYNTDLPTHSEEGDSDRILQTRNTIMHKKQSLHRYQGNVDEETLKSMDDSSEVKNVRHDKIYPLQRDSIDVSDSTIFKEKHFDNSESEHYSSDDTESERYSSDNGESDQFSEAIESSSEDGSKYDVRSCDNRKRKYVYIGPPPPDKKAKEDLPISYDEWDDPNILVDRLRELWESNDQTFSDIKEISRIIKELTLAGYVLN